MFCLEKDSSVGTNSNAWAVCCMFVDALVCGAELNSLVCYQRSGQHELPQ